MFTALLIRDLKLAIRHKGMVSHLLIFFIMIISLFPLSVGAHIEILGQIAPAIIWVAALLVSLLSLPLMFEEDFADGSLEYILLQPSSPMTVIIAKCLSHWIITGLPITLMSPILAYMLHMDVPHLLYLFCTLLIGTMSITLIGAMGASLTLGIKKAAIILPLLTVPFYIPTLIFGTGVMNSLQYGLSSDVFIANMVGLIVMCLLLLPVSIFSSTFAITQLAQE